MTYAVSSSFIKDFFVTLSKNTFDAFLFLTALIQFKAGRVKARWNDPLCYSPSRHSRFPFRSALIGLSRSAHRRGEKTERCTCVALLLVHETKATGGWRTASSHEALHEKPPFFYVFMDPIRKNAFSDFGLKLYNPNSISSFKKAPWCNFTFLSCVKHWASVPLIHPPAHKTVINVVSAELSFASERSKYRADDAALCCFYYVFLAPLLLCCHFQRLASDKWLITNPPPAAMCSRPLHHKNSWQDSRCLKKIQQIRAISTITHWRL